MTNQKPHWNNPAIIKIGQEKDHSFLRPFASRDESIKDSESSRLLSLNGLWKFKWSDSPVTAPKGFEKVEFDKSHWDDISVPADWQLEGYGVPVYVNKHYVFPKNPPHIPDYDNPTGSYYRTFELPPDWVDFEIFLSFDGINSAASIWLNGHEIGYHQDSKTKAEIHINQWLIQGENHLMVQVYRWCDGSYLECQDFWRLSGIERDVYLTARPKVYISDINILADLDRDYTDGLLSVDIEITQKELSYCKPLDVTMSLLDEQGLNILSTTKSLSSMDELTYTLSLSDIIRSPKKWTAETPHLYELYIDLIDPITKAPLEHVAVKVGFRKVEIKEGILQVNGTSVTLKGVNHHEHHEEHGHVVDRKYLEQDIMRIKSYNINAVRNSHYPHCRDWYELCDQYGLYVIDEANIEAHAMGARFQDEYEDSKHTSHLECYRQAHLMRVQSMYHRAKNHASVIIWSLGNEAGNGPNHYATYDWLKGIDASRPVQYEQAGEDDNTDIVCPMYPSVAEVEQYALGNKSRPYIMCEYAHAMGNSLGNLKEYWDLIHKHDILQGGFIWDWMDQGLTSSELDPKTWKFGGEYGHEDVPSDGNFCINGLMFPDGSPHPHAIEAKKLYQNVRITWSPSIDQFGVTNLFDFMSLTDLQVEVRFWTWNNQKGIIDEVLMSKSVSEIAPQKDVIIDCQCPQGFTALDQYYVDVAVRLLSSGEVIGMEQFQNGSTDIHFTSDQECLKPLIDSKEGQIDLITTSTIITIDKQTGYLSGAMFEGKQLLRSPLRLNFWRAPTDNDFGWDMPSLCSHWRYAHDSFSVSSFMMDDMGQVNVNIIHDLLPIEGTITYQVVKNNILNIDYHLNLNRCEPSELIPRIGLYAQLDSAYDHVRWYGRGPHENYIDRKYAAHMGVYKGSVVDFYEPYISTQECGHRCDVRWMQLGNKLNNSNIKIRSQSSFGMTVRPYSSEEITRVDQHKLKSSDLSHSDLIHLYIAVSYTHLTLPTTPYV